jgi:hypothetical protein
MYVIPYILLLLYDFNTIVIAQNNNNNNPSNDSSRNTNDAQLLYGLFGIIGAVILVVFLGFWIRRYNICYISSCINLFCCECFIDTCCVMCDQNKHYDNSEESYCCCCETLTECLSVEDDTLYGQYLDDVVYNNCDTNVDKNMPYSEYKKEYNLQNNLIESDHQFMIKHKELEKEQNDDSEDENTPLLITRIVIND